MVFNDVNICEQGRIFISHLNICIGETVKFLPFEDEGIWRNGDCKLLSQSFMGDLGLGRY